MLKTSGLIKIPPAMSSQIITEVQTAYAAHVLGVLESVAFRYIKYIPRAREIIRSSLAMLKQCQDGGIIKDEYDFNLGEDIAFCQSMGYDAPYIKILTTTQIEENPGHPTQDELTYHITIDYTLSGRVFGQSDLTKDQLVDIYNKYINTSMKPLIMFAMKNTGLTTEQETIENMAHQYTTEPFLANQDEGLEIAILVNLDDWAYRDKFDALRKRTIQYKIDSNEMTLSKLRATIKEDVEGVHMVGELFTPDYTYNLIIHNDRAGMEVDVMINDRLQETKKFDPKSKWAAVSWLETKYAVANDLDDLKDASIEAHLVATSKDHITLRFKLVSDGKYEGLWDPNTWEMTIGLPNNTISKFTATKFKRDISELANTVKHELQHVVQSLWGLVGQELMGTDIGGLPNTKIRTPNYDHNGIPLNHEIQLDQENPGFMKAEVDYPNRDVEFYPLLGTYIDIFNDLVIPPSLFDRAVNIYTGVLVEDLIPKDPSREFCARYGLAFPWNWNGPYTIDGEDYSAEDLTQLLKKVGIPRIKAHENIFWATKSNPAKWKKAVFEFKKHIQD